MEILAQLFGGVARVKIMRLFLFNEGKFFAVEDVASKTRLTKTTIQKELRALEKIGMIKKQDTPKVTAKPAKKVAEKTTTTATKAKKAPSRSRAVSYELSPRFVYTEPLRQLLSLNDPVAHRDITEKLKRAGKLRLVIVTGVFIGRATDRVDLLVVGDNLRKKEIERALVAIETDIGREIAYTYFDTDDFLYRMSVRDRLIRDILDFPHERIVDRLEF